MALSSSLVRTLLLASLLSSAFPIWSQPVGVDALLFEPLTGSILRPTAISSPGDGTGRLFFVAQQGVVRVWDGERLLDRPFLDISDRVVCCGEQGMLDITFHPDYASNGRFFVSYVRNDTAIGWSVISEFAVSADPNLALASERVLIEFAQPTFTHNGGQIRFGSDGMLYASFGDGGLPRTDGELKAQTLDNFLGKILRINIDAGSPYSIPPDNPFVGVDGARGEIWLLGLRNPWRFSFDRSSGDLFIGDVGAVAFEEINQQRSEQPAGRNFGWPMFEANLCTLFGPDCEDEGLISPTIVIPHDEQHECRSITGGFRYRGGELTGFEGRYLFADWCTGEIWAATETAGLWDAGEPAQIGLQVSAFGEDEEGEIYVASYGDSKIYRLRTQWPQPGLSSLQPERVSAGGASFRLTLKGSDFSPGAEVLWDGEPLETTVVNSRTLQALVGPGELASAGSREVLVRNPSPSPGQSISKMVLVEDAAGLQPQIAEGGLVGAARLAAIRLAPGQAFSIFGEALAAFEEQATILPLPTSLGGVTVRIDGDLAAPLLFAAPGQINAVAPWGLPTAGPVSVLVEAGPLRSAAVEIETARSYPGIFTLDQSGSGQGAILIAGTGLLAAPPTGGLAARPVRRGETIEIYAAGIGPVTQPPLDGAPADPPLRRSFERADAWFGTVRSPASFSGLAPGFVGLYQVNVEVPEQIESGDAVELFLAARGVFSNTVTIAVE